MRGTWGYVGRTGTAFGAGLVAGLLVGVGMLVGATWNARREIVLPELPLSAMATHGGDSLIVATGLIDEDVEGIFTLDGVTGDVQCFVLNPRTGTFLARFAHNVLLDLQVDAEKTPKFLMVTGGVRLIGRGSAIRPSNSVLYVAEQNSGNVAAYSIPWNTTLAAGMREQAGPFNLIGQLKARNAAIRE